MILQQRAWYRAEANSALRRLREAGVRITTPDREPFRTAARGVYEDWADRVGGMERIEAILEMGGSGAVR
jgi:TRAP-type C4-dicarboxylate transport system substrate-binding protein